MPSRSEMPSEVYNRDGDNWRPIFAIARLAGGVWLERIREASLQALQTETLPTLVARLLSSIDLAFGDNPKPNTWLDTGELIARLIAQETEQWGTINRGRPIDAYWLRTQLRGLLDPPGAQQWLEQLEGGGRRHHRGYFYNQFADAFCRYERDEPGDFVPGETHTEETPEASGTSATSGTTPKELKQTPDFLVPDAAPDVPDDVFDPVQKKVWETAADEASAPHAPDVPDDFGGLSADGSATDENTAKRIARASRTKPNGGLDLGPEPSLLDYIDAATLADEIRQLHANNPTRSLRWLAKQSGQPPSVVRAILGAGETSQ
jgi:hypothetical protein